MICRLRCLIGPALLVVAGLALDVRLGVTGGGLTSFASMLAMLWALLALERVSNAEVEDRRRRTGQ